MNIPAGFGQATLIYTGAAHPLGAAWTIGFEHTGSGLSPTQAGELISDAESSSVQAFRVNDSNLTSVLIKFGPDDTGPTAEVPASGSGELGLPGTPPANAMLVRKRTALGGRKNRGRLYFPGTADSLWDSSGNMTTGDLAVAAGAWADFGDAVILGGLTLMLLHGDATAPTQITELEPDVHCGTQRRRNRR